MVGRITRPLVDNMKTKILFMNLLKIISVWLVLLPTLIACSKQEKNYTEYVNPFVGAAENGHCHPGACVPFGLIQAGPQSGNCTWTYTAGYQYSDTVLYGFSQTRLSGTGVADLGDLLMLPFTGETGQAQFQSSYRKEEQTATPGFYSVMLSDFNIHAAMTATAHTAIHEYTFNSGDPAHLLIDFQSGNVNSIDQFHQHATEAFQNFETPTRITGFKKQK